MSWKKICNYLNCCKTLPATDAVLTTSASVPVRIAVAPQAGAKTHVVQRPQHHHDTSSLIDFRTALQEPPLRLNAPTPGSGW